VTAYSAAARKVFHSLQDNAIQVAKESIQQKLDAYLEFVELCLVFLDAYPEEGPVFPLEEIGAGHVTGKVSFYRSNWKKIGRILSVFITQN
jgi:hypothetical protein